MERRRRRKVHRWCWRGLVVLIVGVYELMDSIGLFIAPGLSRATRLRGQHGRQEVAGSIPGWYTFGVRTTFAVLTLIPSLMLVSGLSRAVKRAQQRCLVAAARHASSALSRGGLKSLVTSTPGLGRSTRRFSSGKNVPIALTVGDHMHGFTLVQSSTIPDISAQLYVFDHDQSGARLITLSNSDSNKAFGAAFPTPPEDNSGVAHVLEHSVLCGSRSYPTKDPFATLLQSSHQTFLNALTYPDRTCYPVASCNGQDLYNLADVYIDSLLHPKVVEEDYIIRQEGWRVQPGEAPEETSTLQGVVYNEMKGVYSSADMLHYRMIGRALNPENCYRFDSGGDPGCIPRELNQEGLVEFYKAHYHPGRGLFWFYGDGEVGKQVEWLSGKLGEYNRPKSSLDFDNAQKYMQPLRDLSDLPPTRVTFDYDPNMPDFGSKSQVSMAWLLNERRFTMDDRIRYAVFDALMLGRASSPLARKLLDSGLGKSLAIGSGVQDDLRQAVYSVGLKDVAKEDEGKVGELVMKCLGEVRAEGVDPLDVQAALNSVEFKLREFNTGQLPRGVAWFLSVAPEYLYNGREHDVSELMRFEAPLRRLREDIAADKPVFEGIIDGIIGNKHRIVVITSPEEGKGERLRREEKELLEEVQKDGGRQLATGCERMMVWQNSEDSFEDISKIPMLRKADMPREDEEISCDEDQGILWHPEIRTQGLVYADVVFDATGLNIEEQCRLPVVMRGLTELGLHKADSVQQLHRRIEMGTGGISGGIVNVATQGGGRTAAVVRGRCLLEKVEAMADLMVAIVNDCDWLGDRRRLAEVVDELCSNWEQSMLIGAGHQLALSAAYSSLPTHSRVHDANRRSYAQSGLPYYRELLRLRKLLSSEETWEQAAGELRATAQNAMNRDTFAVVSAAGPEASRDAWGSFGERLTAPGSVSQASAVSRTSLGIPGEMYGIVAPSVQIGYNARALTVPDDTDVGTAIVAAQLVNMNYMWQQIRMRGGAYGASCQFNHRSKSFGMTTYRDPHVKRSLEIMRDAGKWLQDRSSLDDRTVEQATVGVIGQLEIGHLMPDETLRTSLIRWLAGESREERQARRLGILGATREGIEDIGRRVGEAELCAEVCIGNGAALEEAGVSPLLPLVDHV